MGLFGLFLLIFVFSTDNLTVHRKIFVIKFCLWLYSNHGSPSIEATALPTEPQRLPNSNQLFRYFFRSHLYPLLGHPVVKIRHPIARDSIVVKLHLKEVPTSEKEHGYIWSLVDSSDHTTYSGFKKVYFVFLSLNLLVWSIPLGLLKNNFVPSMGFEPVTLMLFSHHSAD